MGMARHLLLLSCIALFWSGCGSNGNKVTRPTTPTFTEISGTISTAGTWTGTVKLIADADIAAGVPITIAAGTKFESVDGAVLRVHGNLSIDGTGAAPVSMQPATGATSWGGIVVESGGTAQVRHVTGSKVSSLLTCKAGALACVIDSVTFTDLGQALDASSEVEIKNSVFETMSTNGVVVRAGGTVTITDSVFRGAPGDLVIVSGGALTMSYCNIGSALTSQHGDIFVSSSTHLEVSYCNLTGAVDAISVGGTNAGSVQYCNFIGNSLDVVDLGSNVAVNMTNDYWEGGTPSGLGSAYNFSTPSATPILSAGPRTN